MDREARREHAARKAAAAAATAAAATARGPLRTALTERGVRRGEWLESRLDALWEMHRGETMSVSGSLGQIRMSVPNTGRRMVPGAGGWGIPEGPAYVTRVLHTMPWRFGAQWLSREAALLGSDPGSVVDQALLKLVEGWWGSWDLDVHYALERPGFHVEDDFARDAYRVWVVGKVASSFTPEEIACRRENSWEAPEGPELPE